MRTPAVVMVPGIDGSGPDHWQTIWEGDLGAAIRFGPASWTEPEADDWDRALGVAVASCGAPPVLVAHSLGCLTAARWVQRHPGTVAAALLVAVPDPSGPAFPSEAHGFGAPVAAVLGLPAIVAFSTDDPFSAPAFSRRTAAEWGAEAVDVGAGGHLNAASRLGSWPVGRALLDRLLAAAAR